MPASKPTNETTPSTAERAGLLALSPRVWTDEGIAFYGSP